MLYGPLLFTHLILPLTLSDRTSHHFIFRTHRFSVADAAGDLVQPGFGEMITMLILPDFNSFVILTILPVNFPDDYFHFIKTGIIPGKDFIKLEKINTIIINIVRHQQSLQVGGAV